MPSYIVKPDRDEDFYVMWSEVVDAPTGWGTRAEFKANPWFTPDDVADARFDRADQAGSSASWGDPNDPIYGWQDDAFVYLQRGVLPRGNLREAINRLNTDEHADIGDLLKPFDDETEVRPHR